MAQTKNALGCCYYPEQWPEEVWADDARRMVAMGLTYVRIAEFAWALMEPEEGRYDWGWLDRAVEVLNTAGLKIVLCTPTATPPKWLTDRYPQVLRHEADGLPNKHGGRRHYSVASATYRGISDRITQAIVDRYGTHPSVVGWQTDNEFGCHFSTLSYGPEDCAAFQAWCADKYADIEELNAAWGNSFWSQRYASFDQIELPNRLVADPNPAHWLDFRRFFSDATVAFNRRQVAIIRAGAPGRWVTHNVMLFEDGFDHWDLAADLDFLSWDSYPLGFLERYHRTRKGAGALPESEVEKYLRTGHPDLLAYHHDLYRAMSKQPWWVMEQQPGPVNWSEYNPAPHDGMVAFWTAEAMAHGASTVSYFRWRQAGNAQEQMHTGLNRPWNKLDRGGWEAKDFADRELARVTAQTDAPVDVAIYVDWADQWLLEAMGQGEDQNAFFLAFDWYQAARQLGLNITFFGKDPQTLTQAKHARLFVFPMMTFDQPELLSAVSALCAEGQGEMLFGPRSGARDPNAGVSSFAFDRPPPYLTTGECALFPGLVVDRVESLRPSRQLPIAARNNQTLAAQSWVEHLRLDGSGCQVDGQFDTAAEHVQGLDGAWIRAGSAHYLAFQPTIASALAILVRFTGAQPLPEGLRVRRRGEQTTVTNFSAETVGWGGRSIPARSYLILDC